MQIKNKETITRMIELMAIGNSKTDALKAMYNTLDVRTRETVKQSFVYDTHKRFNIATCPINWVGGLTIPMGAAFGFINGKPWFCDDLRVVIDKSGNEFYRIHTCIDYSVDVVRTTTRRKTEFQYKMNRWASQLISSKSYIGELLAIYERFNPVIVPVIADFVQSNDVVLFRDKRPSERENAVPHNTAGSKHTEIKPRELYRKDGKLRYRAKYHATLSKRVNAAM